MATVAELKRQADNLGIKYTSKVRKAELELMVSDALAARERAAASRIEPMSNWERERVYLAQRNAPSADHVHLLTPRQARRIRRHERRNTPASA